MGRRKFNVDAGGADVTPAEPFAGYDGPTPPVSTYHTNQRPPKILTNKNGDPMIGGWCDIAEPRKKDGEDNDKAQYNGYGIRFNLNVTEQGAPWINQWLLAMCGGDKARFKKVSAEFWGAGPRVNDEDDTILAIGPLKLDPDGMSMVVSTRNNTYEGERRLQVGSFLGLPGSNGSAPDDEQEIDEYADDEDETEEYDDAAEETEDEIDAEEREEELATMNLADLRKEARAAGVEIRRGMKPDAIIQAVIDLEYGAEADASDEDDEDDEDETEEYEEEQVTPVPAKRGPGRPRKGTAPMATGDGAAPAVKRKGTTGRKAATGRKPAVAAQGRKPPF
jgi:hypothetical protein